MSYIQRDRQAAAALGRRNGGVEAGQNNAMQGLVEREGCVMWPQDVQMEETSIYRWNCFHSLSLDGALVTARWALWHVR
jgi:hypothetical protein